MQIPLFIESITDVKQCEIYMKVRKTTYEDDLKFKEEEFQKLTGLQRLEINNMIKERVFGGVHEEWKGMVVRKRLTK